MRADAFEVATGGFGNREVNEDESDDTQDAENCERDGVSSDVNHGKKR